MTLSRNRTSAETSRLCSSLCTKWKSIRISKFPKDQDDYCGQWQAGVVVVKEILETGIFLLIFEKSFTKTDFFLFFKGISILALLTKQHTRISHLLRTDPVGTLQTEKKTSTGNLPNLTENLQSAENDECRAFTSTSFNQHNAPGEKSGNQNVSWVCLLTDSRYAALTGHCAKSTLRKLQFTAPRAEVEALRWLHLCQFQNSVYVNIFTI